MGMRTQVEFRAPKFPAYPGEEERINPDMWGKRLAEYLRDELRERGIETREPIAEDWGWLVPIRNVALPMALGCGHCHNDLYLVFIEPSKSMVRRWLFKKVDTRADVTRVADAIDAVLTSDPDIRDVCWENEG
jgi:hypothetical protein